MYCVKCGVLLDDSLESCPLCHTPAYRPAGEASKGERSYPDLPQDEERFSHRGVQIAATVIFVIAAVVCLICDMGVNSRVIWSGFALGGIALAYVTFVLPGWFQSPEPFIFAPIFFVSLLGYLLYLDLATSGESEWFLTFAFPLVGIVGACMCVLITLVRFLKRGRLFIFGGFFIALGCFCLLFEFFGDVTFASPSGFQWAFFPLVPLCLFGIMLIVTGFLPSLKSSLQKKLFI